MLNYILPAQARRRNLNAIYFSGMLETLAYV
jgi:hypothetical protein